MLVSLVLFSVQEEFVLGPVPLMLLADLSLCVALYLALLPFDVPAAGVVVSWAGCCDVPVDDVPTPVF